LVEIENDVAPDIVGLECGRVGGALYVGEPTGDMGVRPGSNELDKWYALRMVEI